MECNYIISEDQYLAHHGIKGQKWGVRRYQNSDGSLTDLGRRRYMKTTYGMSKFAGFRYKNMRGEDMIGSGYYELSSPGPDDNGHRTYDTPVSLKDSRLSSDYLDNPDTVFSKHYTKVNPSYGHAGTTQNCTKCSATMILAKKGYDFEAGRSDTGFSEAFDYWFDGAEQRTFDGQMGARSYIVQSKPGSYGTIDFRLKVNPRAGHVINWEHNSDGTFSLFDSQSGTSTTCDTLAECLEDYNDSVGNMFNMDDRMGIFDLTDATPNWSHIQEDSVVRFGSADGNSKLYDPRNRTLFEVR